LTILHHQSSILPTIEESTANSEEHSPRRIDPRFSFPKESSPMMALASPRTAYPTDLTDAQWRQIAPLLPDDRPKGRHRVTSLREVVSAIHYRDQTGCPWRMLPDDFPAWGTVYSYYRRWNRAGILAEIRQALSRGQSPEENAGRLS
jgi:hypothetical protein